MTPGARIHLGGRTSRAFTLVEIIVVMVVLGVLSGLIAPRMLASDQRRAQQTVRALASMLSVVAERDAFGQHRMSLRHDPIARTLSLYVLRQTGPSERGAAEPAWRPDPLTPQLALESLRLADVRFDGRPPVNEEWRVEFVPGIPRPLIEMVVEVDTNDERRAAWLIELLPYAPAADVVSVTSAAGIVQGRSARSVDLDEMGRSDVPW